MRVKDSKTQIVASLIMGLIVGGFVGRLTAPSVENARASAAPDQIAKDKKPPSSGIGDIIKLVDQAEDYLDSEGAGLSAVGDILTTASMSDLLNWGKAPEMVSRSIINEMSDEELVSTITSITKIGSEDLDEISDLRDYAGRLTHIAMSGIITPDIADEFDNATVSVEFGSDASSSGGAEEASLEFEVNTRKIYAVIPNLELSGDNVMVHWYRIDQPENLLFDQYKVSPGDDYSYVWLKSQGGWDPGNYRVEFFSADETLAPIASGTYRVVGE
jgi:hypothetical protein